MAACRIAKTDSGRGVLIRDEFSDGKFADNMVDVVVGVVAV